MSWDPVNKLWVPAPPAPGSITTSMLVANAATAVHSVKGTTTGPNTTSATFVDIPDMTITFTPTVVTDAWAIFTTNFQNSSNTALAEVQIVLDGAAVSPLLFVPQDSAASNVQAFAAQVFLPALSAAAHTVKVQWLTPAGTLGSTQLTRAFTVIEFRR